jgi:hypothetical protein
MKKYIKYANELLDVRPKLRQWLWLLLLWIGGMVSFWLLAIPVKLLIKSLG